MGTVKLLAIDGSTEACSAALLLGAEIVERYEVRPQAHAGLFLPMVEGLLAEAGLALGGLDALAFGRGPGAFTGLRITAGVAQGLAFSADLPVVPVSSLAALAQGAYRSAGAAQVLAAMDARLREVYWGQYRLEGERMMLAGEEQVCAPGHVPVPDTGGWTGVGSAWSVYQDQLRARCAAAVDGWIAPYYPHARDVASLAVYGLRSGAAVPAELALPVYLRDNVAVSAQ